MMYYDEDFIQKVTEAVNKGLAVPYATERLLSIIKQQNAEIEQFKADKALYAAEHEQLDRNFQSAKANIVRLDILNTDIFAENVVLQMKLDKAKTEAIKEFAERLKEKSEHFELEKENFVSEEDIDNLVKEMVGDVK